MSRAFHCGLIIIIIIIIVTEHHYEDTDTAKTKLISNETYPMAPAFTYSGNPNSVSSSQKTKPTRALTTPCTAALPGSQQARASMRSLSIFLNQRTNSKLK